VCIMRVKPVGAIANGMETFLPNTMELKSTSETSRKTRGWN